MIEERVASDFYFVEVDVGVVGVHADGRGIANEMDVVAADGQFLAEFRGDYTGAAVRRIAGYANAHDGFVILHGSRVLRARFERLAGPMPEC